MIEAQEDGKEEEVKTMIFIIFTSLLEFVAVWGCNTIITWDPIITRLTPVSSLYSRYFWVIKTVLKRFVNTRGLL